jgi:SAM-dependent methyltransferase
MNGSLGYVSPSYLATVGAAVQGDKERSYDVLAIRPGAALLDVGCGTGLDTVALAARVGPTGRVVGVDHDPAMLAEADRRAQAAEMAGRVTHERADATALPFPDASFDGCRSERLFQHLSDPAAALAEMARVTRPGGRLAVLDTDWATFSVDTSEVDVERRLARFMAEHRCRNGYAGRQLLRLFRAVGLADVTVELRPLVVTDLALLRLGAGLDELERAAEAVGVVTAAEVARWRAGLAAASTAGTLFASIALVLVAGRTT